MKVMKTLGNFLITMVTAAAVIGSSALMNLASAETVRGQAGSGKNAAVKSASKTAENPTPEEAMMGAVASPYPSCEGYVMVESSAYEKNKKFWEDHAKNCSTENADCSRKVLQIPDTGMFKSFKGQTGKNLTSQLTAVAFLDKVAEKSIEKMKTGISQYEVLKNCIDKRAAGTSCDTMTKNLRERITKNLPAFRRSMALMMEADPNLITKSIVTGDSGVFINKDVHAAKSKAIGPRMAPLSSQEYNEIKADLDATLKQAKVEWDAETSATIAKRGLTGVEASRERERLMEPRNYGTKVRSVMDKKRDQATMDYIKVLGVAPELAYIGDPSLPAKETSERLSKMISDLKSNLEDMTKAKSKRKEEMTSEKMDSSLLRFAANTRVIEDMLREEKEKGSPSSCAVATAVHNELQTVKGQSAVLGMVGLIGAPFMTVGGGALAGRFLAAGGALRAATVAGNLAVAEGVIGGSALTVMDVRDQLQLEKDAKTGLVRWDDAKEALSGPGASLALAPFDFVGGKVVLGASAGLAAKGIGKLFTGAAARGKVATKLSAKEIQELSLRAQKGDSAAAKTLATLAEQGEKSLLGGRAATAGEREAVEVAGTKGYLGTAENPDVGYVRALGDDTKKLSAGERKTFGEKLQGIFASLKPAGAQGGSERVEAVKDLATDFAHISPSTEGAASVLNNPAFDAETLRGMKVVTDEVVKGTGPVDQRTLEALAQKTAGKPYEKLSTSEKSKVDGMCGCMKVCGSKTVTMIDGIEYETPVPRFVCSVETRL